MFRLVLSVRNFFHAHSFDGGDCEHCPVGHPDNIICPEPSNAEAVARRECAPGCANYMTSNNRCDPACNNAACGQDGGDCAEDCAPGCTQDLLRNNYCDDACNVDACRFDDGVCKSPMSAPPGTPTLYNLDDRLGCTPGDGTFLAGQAQYCPRQRLVNLGAMTSKEAVALLQSQFAGMPGERPYTASLGMSATDFDTRSTGGVYTYTSAMLLSATVDGVAHTMYGAAPPEAAGNGSASAWEAYLSGGNCQLHLDGYRTATQPSLSAIDVEAAPAAAATCDYDLLTAALNRYETMLAHGTAEDAGDDAREAVRRLAVNVLLGEGAVQACVQQARSLVTTSHPVEVFIRDTKACLDPTDLSDPCCHPELTFFECCAPRSFLQTIAIADTFDEPRISQECPTAAVADVRDTVQAALQKWEAAFELGTCDAQDAVNECTETALLSVVDACEEATYGADGTGPRCSQQGDCAHGVCNAQMGRCVVPPEQRTRLFFDCFVARVDSSLWSFMLHSLLLPPKTTPDELFEEFQLAFVEPVCSGPTGAEHRPRTELRKVDASCDDAAVVCERVVTEVTPTQQQCEATQACNWYQCAASMSAEACAAACTDAAAGAQHACYQCADDSTDAECTRITEFARCTNPYVDGASTCSRLGGRWQSHKRECVLPAASTQAACMPAEHCPDGVLQTVDGVTRCAAHCYNADATDESACDPNTVLLGGKVFQAWDAVRGRCMWYNPAVTGLTDSFKWCNNVAKGTFFPGAAWDGGSFTTEEECGRGMCAVGTGDVQALTAEECASTSQCTGQCTTCASSVGLGGVCQALGVVFAAHCTAIGGVFDYVDRLCFDPAADSEAACDAVDDADAANTWSFLSCAYLSEDECVACHHSASCLGYTHRGAVARLQCSMALQPCELGVRCAFSGTCDDVELTNTETGQPGVCAYRFAVSECGQPQCRAGMRLTAVGCVDDRVESRAACNDAFGSWTPRARTREQCEAVTVCVDGDGTQWPGRSEEECRTCGASTMQSVYTWTPGKPQPPQHVPLRWMAPAYGAVNTWNDGVNVVKFRKFLARSASQMVFQREVNAIKCKAGALSDVRRFACMCGQSSTDCSADVGVVRVQLGQSTCVGGSSECAVQSGPNAVRTDVGTAVQLTLSQADTEMSTNGNGRGRGARRALTIGHRRRLALVTTVEQALVQVAPALTITTDVAMSTLNSTSEVCLELPLGTVAASDVQVCAATGTGTNLACQPDLVVTVTSRADGRICFSTVLADVATLVSSTTSVLFAPMEERNVTSTTFVPDAVDCVVSAWGALSTCSAQCGGGQTTRTRTVSTVNLNGGATCPALVETTACNTEACPAAPAVAAGTALTARITRAGLSAATTSASFLDAFRTAVASVAGSSVQPTHVFITDVRDVLLGDATTASGRRLGTGNAVDVDFYVDTGSLTTAFASAIGTLVESSMVAGTLSAQLCTAGECGTAVAKAERSGGDSASSGLSGGAMAGIVIGACIGIGLVGGAVIMLRGKTDGNNGVMKSGKIVRAGGSSRSVSGGKQKRKGSKKTATVIPRQMVTVAPRRSNSKADVTGKMVTPMPAQNGGYI